MKTFEVAVTSQQGVIDFSNYEQLKSELENNLAKFRDLVVDKESLSEYKSIRANLNKVYDLLDKERKRIKKSYSEPLVEFENKAKTLTKLVDEVSDQIDSQIKEIEFEIKKEKLNSIEVYYEKLKLNLPIAKTVEFKLILDQDWLNASYTFPKIEKEIKERLQKVSEEIELLKMTDVSDKQLLLSFYLETLSMSSAINAYKAHTERFDKAQQIIPQKQEQPSERTESALKSKSEEMLTVSFQVSGTYEQLQALSEYMNELNIAFMKI